MANLSIIRELCKEKNISLKKLGEEIGIKTPQGVQRMINDNSTTIDRLEKISKLLKVPIWRFFDFEGETLYAHELEAQKNRSKIIEETLEQMTNVIAEFKRKHENLKTVTYSYLAGRECVAMGFIDIKHYEIMNNLLLDFLISPYDANALEIFMTKMKPIMETRPRLQQGDKLTFKGSASFTHVGGPITFHPSDDTPDDLTKPK